MGIVTGVTGPARVIDIQEDHGRDSGGGLGLVVGQTAKAPRASMFLTDVAYHLPPRAVDTPRAFSASAMSRSDGRTVLLSLTDKRKHVGGVLVCIRLDGSLGDHASLSELRTTKDHTASFRSRKGVLGAHRNHGALFLRSR